MWRDPIRPWHISPTHWFSVSCSTRSQTDPLIPQPAPRGSGGQGRRRELLAAAAVSLSQEPPFALYNHSRASEQVLFHYSLWKRSAPIYPTPKSNSAHTPTPLYIEYHLCTSKHTFYNHRLAHCLAAPPPPEVLLYFSKHPMPQLALQKPEAASQKAWR